jgi:hypothetical protein
MFPDVAHGLDPPYLRPAPAKWRPINDLKDEALSS